MNRYRGACAILVGMSGATFRRQNEAPPVTPVTPFSYVGDIPSVVNFKNPPENHPSPTTNLIQVDQSEPVVLRPGDYQPCYAEMMIAYFDQPKMREVIDTYTWKSGAVTEKKRELPRTPPHFSTFARSIGVSTRKLKLWARQYEEFGEAYQTCQEILEEFLIDNGLTGSYGAIAMKFVAVNRTKMKDKVVTENVTLDINKVLDKIAAGEVRPGGMLEMGHDED